MRYVGLQSVVHWRYEHVSIPRLGDCSIFCLNVLPYKSFKWWIWVSLRDFNFTIRRAVSVIPTTAAKSLLLIYDYFGKMLFRKEISARQST